MEKKLATVVSDTSPPSRRRGLKSSIHILQQGPKQVASFAEAWIEIFYMAISLQKVLCRLLRGGVD